MFEFGEKDCGVATDDDSGISTEGRNDACADAALLILGSSNLFCRGLARALGRRPFSKIKIASIKEVSHFKGQRSDLILVDVASGMNVEKLLRGMTEVENVPIVVLADHFSFDTYSACLEYRASGYFLKDTTIPELKVGLQFVLNGKMVFPSYLAQHQIAAQHSRILEVRYTQNGAPRKRIRFTRQEVRVLELLVEGASNKVIARQLGNSHDTIKVHMKAILRKLSLQNRTQAAIWADRNGFGHKPKVQSNTPDLNYWKTQPHLSPIAIRG